MATLIGNNAVSVGSLQSTSSVMVGQNNTSGWESFQKQNSSIGSQGQGNLYPANLNVFTDNDMVDYPVNNSDFEPNIQTQNV